MIKKTILMLLICGLTVTHNSLAMDPKGANNPEDCDPALHELHTNGRHALLRDQAKREAALISFIREQFNQNSREFLSKFVGPIAHSTQGYSYNNLEQLINNLGAKARRDGLNQDCIEKTIAEMDQKIPQAVKN